MSLPMIIVLDPGHGGSANANGSRHNNATSRSGILEKDLNLSVACSAARLLRDSGQQVILTRDSNQNISLVGRATKAKEAGADVFVSIHFNGHPDVNIDGTEVYIAEAAGNRDRVLASRLLAAIAPFTGLQDRGVRTADFAVLSGEAHVAKTAACLVEMAFLSNPAQAQRLANQAYVDQLGAALAQGIMGYSMHLASAQTLEGHAHSAEGERVIYKAEREHADPKEVPIDLPKLGRGQDRHRFSVPEGLLLSRWDVQVKASSLGAGYRVTSAPKASARGSQAVEVDWWHMPYGKIHYRVHVFASPDGRSRPVKVVYNSPGWLDRVRDQVHQGTPISMVVRGRKAKLLYDAIRHAQPGSGEQSMPTTLVAGEEVAVVLGLALLAAVVLVIGMASLGVILKEALEKGYDVKDTGYKAAVGEGASRQEHEMVFNLTRPK
jgi:N-acetylmuramoyl-L-alanine amidase